jgi:hypothetical protein
VVSVVALKAVEAVKQVDWADAWVAEAEME